MTLSDYLDYLKTLSSQDAIQGAYDAAQKVLMSKLGQGGQMPPGIPLPDKIGVDPDLKEVSGPSNKNSNMDIDIDDPDHVLDQNDKADSDKNMDKNSSSNNSDQRAGDGGDISENSSDGSDDADEDGPLDNGSSQKGSQTKDSTSGDGGSNDDQLSDKSSEKGPKDSQINPEDRAAGEADDEYDWDDQNLFSGNEEDDRIKINRNDILQTVGEGRMAIADAKNRIANGDKSISEKSIEKVKGIVDDLKRNIDDYSKLDNESVDTLINTAVEAIKELDVKYKEDDVNARIKKFTRNKEDIINNISIEDRETRKANINAARAREDEINKYSNLKGLDSFKLDLEQCIENQIKYEKEKVQSYQAINSRHEDDPYVVMPGSKVEQTLQYKKPKITVFFDQSGSWSTGDVTKGNNAMAALAKWHSENLIDLDIWYFSDVLTKVASSNQLHEGTRAWTKIIKQIKDSNTDNVILITDRDMRLQAAESSVTWVQGCVWLIWKNSASYCKEIAEKLKGGKMLADGGNREYALY